MRFTRTRHGDIFVGKIAAPSVDSVTEPHPEQPPPDEYDVATFYAKVALHGVGGRPSSTPPGFRLLDADSNVAVRESD